MIANIPKLIKIEAFDVTEEFWVFNLATVHCVQIGLMGLG